MYDVDIMMLGHFAKDKLVVDGTGEIASGGGVYYGSIALRQLGVRVAIVTRLHADDFPRLDELKQEGVQVFATGASETSGIENIYNSADMERRICKPLGFAGPFRRDEIPDLSARVTLIVPIIAGEVDLALLKSLAGRGPVGLDVQGFVRVRERESLYRKRRAFKAEKSLSARLRSLYPRRFQGKSQRARNPNASKARPQAAAPTSWDSSLTFSHGLLVFRQWSNMTEGLAQVTYLKVDRAEAELLTGQANLREAACQLAAHGPREVIVTQSSGVTVYADGQIYEAPFTPCSLAGRTGRGDTCFAVYVGRRLSAPPEEATRFAAAVTTLKQEKPGPWRGSLDDVAALLDKIRYA